MKLELKQMNDLKQLIDNFFSARVMIQKVISFAARKKKH